MESVVCEFSSLGLPLTLDFAASPIAAIPYLPWVSITKFSGVAVVFLFVFLTAAPPLKIIPALVFGLNDTFASLASLRNLDVSCPESFILLYSAENFGAVLN